MSNTRAVAPARRPAPPRIAPILTARWQACWEGHEPAEILDTAERELLVAYLVEGGLTDREIAAHTRMTLYTTVRIRQRLGLDAAVERPGTAHLIAADLRTLRTRYGAGEPISNLVLDYDMDARDIRRVCRDLLVPTMAA